MDVSDDLDPNKYLDLQAKGFQIGGLWVDEYKETWKYWIHRIHRAFVIVFVLCLPILGQALYLINDAEADEFIGSLNILVTEGFISVKSFSFIYHRSVVVRLLRHIRSNDFEPSRPEHQSIVRVAMWRGRIIAKIFYVMCPFVVAGSNGHPSKTRPHPVLLNFKEQSSNGYRHWATEADSLFFTALICSATLVSILGFCVVPVIKGERRIPTTMNFVLFDINVSPSYEIAYFFHSLYKPLIVIIFVAIQTTPVALMSCAMAQLDILIFNLEKGEELVAARRELSSCSAEEAATNLLRNCVHHHKSIIRFTKDIESAFGVQFFFQFICTCLIICMSGVEAMNIESAKDNIADMVWIVAYLLHTFTDVYITCAFGNAITTKSAYLTTAAYNGWAVPSAEAAGTGRAALRRSLLVFMTRTQRPLVLRAANFFTVSIDTYAKMMNWTYKAFAIINQTT